MADQDPLTRRHYVNVDAFQIVEDGLVYVKAKGDRIPELYVRADAVEPSRHDRIVTRLMTFGGFQRTERGEFWVSRDDVLRLLDEEFGVGSPPEEKTDDGGYRLEHLRADGTRDA